MLSTCRFCCGGARPGVATSYFHCTTINHYNKMALQRYRSKEKCHTSHVTVAKFRRMPFSDIHGHPLDHWLVVWNMCDFSRNSWECRNPNWRTHEPSFFRGVGVETTNQTNQTITSTPWPPHLTMVITTINPSEIVVMFTNWTLSTGGPTLQDGQISYTEFLGATLNLDEAQRSQRFRAAFLDGSPWRYHRRTTTTPKKTWLARGHH